MPVNSDSMAFSLLNVFVIHPRSMYVYKSCRTILVSNRAYLYFHLVENIYPTRIKYWFKLGSKNLYNSAKNFSKSKFRLEFNLKIVLTFHHDCYCKEFFTFLIEFLWLENVRSSMKIETASKPDINRCEIYLTFPIFQLGRFGNFD